MHTSGAQLVAAYSKGNPKERFTLIYRNYCIFLQTINSYETGVYNRILCEKQYNCHASNYSSHLRQLYRKINPTSPSYRLSQRAVFYGTFLSALLTIPILSHIVFS